MDRIERYIDSITKNIDGSSETVNNLKEEIRSHIYQMVKELMDEGKGEYESITIALDSFGEENEIKRELMQEFKPHRKVKIPVKSIIISALCIIGLIFGYQSFNGNQWSKNLQSPDGITIRDKFDAPLITGTAVFEGEIQINDKKIVNKVINMIKNAKNVKKCSKNEANNFDIRNVKFSIGTVVFRSYIPQDTLGTINIFKDGTFIASKKVGPNDVSYIKGKLGKEDIKYIEEIYHR